MPAESSAVIGATSVPAAAATEDEALAYASASELQAQMANGTLSAERLVRACLANIEAIDRNGPQLRSIIELNADALPLAAALDVERRDKGPHRTNCPPWTK